MRRLVLLGASLVVVSSLIVKEVAVHTGAGSYAPGTNGFLHYRLVSTAGEIIAETSGADIMSFEMNRDGVAVSVKTDDNLWIQFGPFASGARGGWRRLPVDVRTEYSDSSYSPAGADAVFAGTAASEVGFVELVYLSTNGWELAGLTVVVADDHDAEPVVYTWKPETAWPKLYSPFDDFDSIFLDLDDNFTDASLASDPYARVQLTRTCDAVISVTTGDSGAWAPGVDLMLHYKLLDERGQRVPPARGPPPKMLSKNGEWSEVWEPPHVSMDDELTRREYGGLWSLDKDWRHLDEIDVTVAGAASVMHDVAAWDCGGVFASSASAPALGGVEIIYGPSTDGWELARLEVALSGGPSRVADLASEFPRKFGTFDSPDSVFLDYDSGCAQQSYDEPRTCESDWYMRFKFISAGSQRDAARDAAPVQGPQFGLAVCASVLAGAFLGALALWLAQNQKRAAPYFGVVGRDPQTNYVEMTSATADLTERRVDDAAFA